MTSLLEKIQEEFNHLQEVFTSMKQAIDSNDTLVTFMARHPLFEIEPFESLLRNELITEEERALLFVQDPKEVNPEWETLYLFRAAPQSQRIYHRISYDEDRNRKETVFDYKDNYHKSLTLHAYGERVLPKSVCYVFFKNSLPDIYLECTPSGILSRKYRIENNRLSGYHETSNYSRYVCDVVFEYNELGTIELIKKYVQGESPERPEILFKRPEPGLTQEAVFRAIEDFLVERITEELQRVRIEGEVYFLMMEYYMPDAFPPEIRTGLVADLKAPFETMDLHQLYCNYSATNTLQLDLYDEKTEYLYLFYYRAYNYKTYKRQTFEYWNDQIRQVYLKVCQRLMYIDFSASFKTSEHFLILAQGDYKFDLEFFHQKMTNYKKEKLI